MISSQAGSFDPGPWWLGVFVSVTSTITFSPFCAVISYAICRYYVRQIWRRCGNTPSAESNLPIVVLFENVLNARNFCLHRLQERIAMLSHNARLCHAGAEQFPNQCRSVMETTLRLLAIQAHSMASQASEYVDHNIKIRPCYVEHLCRCCS